MKNVYKININETTIKNVKVIDAFFFINDCPDIRFYSLKIPNNLIDVINSFITCSNNQAITEELYNFIKKEIINILPATKETEIKDKIAETTCKRDTLVKENNLTNEDINLAVIVFSLNYVSNIKYSIRDNKLYKQNSNTPVPLILCRYLNDACQKNDSEYIKALDLFWTNCLLRHDQSNIEDLFIFINNNGLTITPNGYLFTFRRIKSRKSSNNNELFEFIVNSWKEFMINKQSFDGLYVANIDNEYYLTDNFDNILSNSSIIGSFKDLVTMCLTGTLDVPVFTDNHSGKFNYKVGSTYVVDNVDNNVNNTCSYGLHLGSKSYVKSNTWLGETIVGCIVNPRDIIAVSDSMSKLRVRKMHIACLISENELDNFNAQMFNFDYEALDIPDRTEFEDYLFNEEYNKNSETERKIVELETLIDDLTKELERYSNQITTTKEEITKLLQNNFK
jgi:hypothetical protein